jgi:hypothetical protein
MLKVGDTVKWMCPLDHDYFCGEIVSIKNRFATIKGIGLYKHITAEVHFKYIKKVAGGKGFGSGKRNR